MDGYATLGSLYLLRYPGMMESLLWAVIENNSNDKTSTLMVVEECKEKGMKAKVNSDWLYNRAPLGPVFQPEGVVVEKGREYIKQTQRGNVVVK